MPVEIAKPFSVDVAIVGGGPIGIELAAAIQRLGWSCRIFEAGQIGHTISWWAPGTRWFSSNDRIAIAGVPLESPDQTKSTREQYLTYLRAVVRQFRLDVSTFTKVVDVQQSEQGFTVKVERHGLTEIVHAKAVVLAIGGTDSPKLLDVPGADLPHVDSYFREPHRYFNRDLLIIGGRNSAVEAALRANQCGARVSLSYRQEYLPRESIKYWLLPEIEGLIRTGRITAYFNSFATRITPNLVQLEKFHGSYDSEEQHYPLQVKADDVLSLIGYQQDKTLLERCGVTLIGESRRPDFDNETMQTNISGLFVAGTAIAGTQSSKYRIFVENCHTHVGKIVKALSKNYSFTETTSDSKTSSPTAKSEVLLPPLFNRGDETVFAAKIEAMPES